MRYRFIRPVLPAVGSWAGYLEPAYITRHFSNFGPVNQRFEAAMTRALVVVASPCLAQTQQQVWRRR